MRVNQFEMFYVLRRAMRIMREQKGGAIVCTTSTSGIRGVPQYVPIVRQSTLLSV